MSLRTAVGAALSRNIALDCRFVVALADSFSYYSGYCVKWLLLGLEVRQQ